MSAEKLHIDIPLAAALLALNLLAFPALYSASGQDLTVVMSRGVHLGIAVVALLAIARVPPTRLARLSPGLYLLGLALLGLTLLVGDTGKGAQRWLSLGIVRFQPSELMKLVLPMMLAWYLGKSLALPGVRQLCVTLVLISLPVLLVARQPDLGTAVLVAATGCSVLFVAGIGWRWLLGSGLLALASTPALWFSMHDYQRTRIMTFLNPEQDPLGAGYHIIQSKIAIGSGGIYGKGWLNGTQSQLEFLPERSTDFVFAVFCEEFGLLGVSFLLAVYLFTIGRGLYIALQAEQLYGRLLAVGLMTSFFIYIFVNMGMVSGQLPVVGIPLPLISHGGSSMLTIMAGFGMLMSIHTHKRLLSD